MATLLTHAFVGGALADFKRPYQQLTRWWIIAAFCSMLPDIDVIGFAFGIRYGDLWGHRGFTHSLLFAAAVSLTAAQFMRGQPPGWPGKKLVMALWLFLITASHGFLDAMTNGGLGVAFFSPFDRHRYFFSWRPIAVSPIGTHGLSSSRMAHILSTELFWVWIPMALVWLMVRGLQNFPAKAARPGNPCC
jgi:inner membrane protein